MLFSQVLAPAPGFEPGTISLTGSRSTAELRRNVVQERLSDSKFLFNKKSAFGAFQKFSFKSVFKMGGLPPEILLEFRTRRRRTQVLLSLSLNLPARRS